MENKNPKRHKKLLRGAGYDGEKIETELEHYITYCSKVRTTKDIEIKVEGADNWLQFHYQLAGSTNTFVVNENKNIAIGPNTFAVLYQKKGCCLIQFPENTVYESFGFRVDPTYFTNSFLKDFNELSSIKEAILDHKTFQVDNTYSNLDVKTREIISSITNNPFEGNLEQVYIENKIIELIFHSIPVLKKRGESIVSRKKGFESEIQQAKAYIIENLDEKLTIERIARHCGLNQFTLKTRFKEYMGQGVIDFYIELKLKRAYEEIQNGDKKITAIAYEAGYSTVGNFSNAFLKRYGFRPSKLREA